MRELLADAQRGNYAVGSFSVANMEMVLGVLKAARELNAPVILQIAEVRLKQSPLEIIGPDVVSLHGGMFGTFVKTTGKSGDAVLTIETEQAGKVEVAFTIEIEYNNN